MAFPLHSTIEQRIGACLDRGDVKQAATEALRGYGPQILAYLSGVLRDDEAAAEVFSEFSEDLWRGIGAFRRESSFRTWAYRLAWNAARQLARDPFRKRGQRVVCDCTGGSLKRRKPTTVRDSWRFGEAQDRIAPG